MPNRLLRDGILRSERIGDLSPTAELFYRRLMSVVDDFGRYYARPKLLLADCYPLLPDWANVAMVEQSLEECRKQELLVLYEANGLTFLELTNFNQRIRPGQVSKFPASAESSREVREIFAHATTTPPTTPPAVVVVSEKPTTPEVSQAVIVLDPETSPLEIFERTENLYQQAGVPTAAAHRQLILQHLLSIAPELRERIPRYVAWALGTGRWNTPGKTKGFLSLMQSGDWNVELTRRTLPAAREPTKRESAIQQAARALREEVHG